MDINSMSKILKVFLFAFMIITSQEVQAQDDEIEVDRRYKGIVVLPTIDNILLAFDRNTFLYNIKTKYGYTNDEGNMWVARTGVGTPIYGVEISENQEEITFIWTLDNSFYDIAFESFKRVSAPYRDIRGYTRYHRKFKEDLYIDVFLSKKGLSGSLLVQMNHIDIKNR